MKKDFNYFVLFRFKRNFKLVTNMIFEICVLFLVIYILWFYFENFVNVEGKPPGPIRIPPFGNLIQIGIQDRLAHIALHKLAKKYGPVMSIKMGLLETVVLSSHESVRQVLTKEEASGRDCTGFVLDRNLGNQRNGIVFSEGPINDATRKYCSDTLKIYGLGNRETVRNMFLDEFTEFLQLMEKDANGNTEHRVHFTSDYFNPPFLNIMSTLLIGKRYSYDDTKFQRILLHEREYISSGVFGSGIILAYPFLRHIFPKLLAYDVQIQGIRGLEEIARKFLSERRNASYETNPTCFTDNYLQKMDEVSSAQTNSIFTAIRGTSEYYYFFYKEDHFAVLFCDIVQGGTETASNVVNFILLHLVNNQQIQEKVYREILDVIGPNQFPNLDHKVLMPYTHAVILEGLRWNRVIVLGAPRKVLNNFVYRNYLIKKGTVLMGNLHSVFFDKEFWGDPEVFRPERFLDQNGKFVTKKVDAVQLAFGAGKRSCFGEAMARDSLFIVTTTLIQRFKFSLPAGAKPNLEPKIAITLSVHPYDAIVARRTL